MGVKCRQRVDELAAEIVVVRVQIATSLGRGPIDF
jgi:hypothetical protein